MYINAGTFILQRSYSHHTLTGNLVKTRSKNVYILYNRISAEDGTDSYEIDIPNGGRAYIVGNVIQQGASSQNRWIVEFGAEGQTAGHTDELFVVNNTIVNDVGTGYGIFVASWAKTPAVVRNNIFAGPFNTIVNQATALLQSNHLPADGDPMFVDAAAYDYRLKAGSPAIDKAVAPGSAFGFDWRRSSSTCTRFSTSPARPRVLAPQAVPTATSWANRSSRSADLTGGAGA